MLNDVYDRILTRCSTPLILSALCLLGPNARADDDKGIIIVTHKVRVEGLYQSSALDGIPVTVTLLGTNPIEFNHVTPAEQTLLGTPSVMLTVPEFYGDYRHVSWYEGLTQVSQANSITIDLDTDRTFTVLYTMQQRILDVASAPDSGVTIAFNDFDSITTPQGLAYNIHSAAQLTAPEEHNNRPFARWLVDGEEYTKNRILELTMDDDHDAVAEYGTGLVKVYIKPKAARRSGARWRVDGGPWLKHKQIADDVLVGEGHTIEFKDIDGFKTPKDKTVDVTYNTLSESRGKYVTAR